MISFFKSQFRYKYSKDNSQVMQINILITIENHLKDFEGDLKDLFLIRKLVVTGASSKHQFPEGGKKTLKYISPLHKYPSKYLFSFHFRVPFVHIAISVICLHLIFFPLPRTNPFISPL